MQWIENISQHVSEEVNGEPSNNNACGWGVVAENPDAVDRANSQHASKTQEGRRMESEHWNEQWQLAWIETPSDNVPYQSPEQCQCQWAYS